MSDPPQRRPAGATYAIFYLAFALLLFLGHSPYLTLPYFWDELGQFIPAALDILHDGAWVPHSAIPNVHPPGVMAYLALVWKVAGYSIAAARSAMLAVAALGVLFSFLLAIRLCQGLPGWPAFVAALLLLADPLFYTQSMLAQLDMPAMALTAGALLLFLDGRHRWAALACTALALTKETGILLALVCGLALLAERGRERQAWFYLAPCLALGMWLAVLFRTTGHPFGDAAFTHYNLEYSLHPVRAATALLRRGYYLGIADGRWLGWVAIAVAWRRGLFASRAWRVTGVFVVLHVIMVSLLGGAELERYLLPVLPLLYIAMAAAWSGFSSPWRTALSGALALGLLAGLIINPPYPFPFENNLAMTDLVELQQAAAAYVEREYTCETIYTAWPLTAALRIPAYGYVRRGMKAEELGDFRRSAVLGLDPRDVRVLVLYSRVWDPPWSLLRLAWVRDFLGHYYEYQAAIGPEECGRRLRLTPRMRWTRRGQWIEVWAKEGPQKHGAPESIAYDDSYRRSRDGLEGSWHE